METGAIFVKLGLREVDEVDGVARNRMFTMFAVTMGDSADDLDPARFDMGHPGTLGVEVFVGGETYADRGRLMRAFGDDFGRRVGLRRRSRRRKSIPQGSSRPHRHACLHLLIEEERLTYLVCCRTGFSVGAGSPGDFTLIR
jgi:hypothetical protein